MSTTLIDLMAEAEAIREKTDPNPGVCTRCQEEKIARSDQNICATCVYSRLTGIQGEN